MPLYSVSVMSRVLAMPELLDMIFQLLDTHSNASNAVVCKQWSEVALDVLWRDVEDLPRLLSLLAPIRKESDDHLLKFVRPLESSDWRRFERYRHRIRSLSCEDVENIHDSVFDDIARSRTSLDIFPSMHVLRWDAPLPLCVIFMHRNIKKFILDISAEDSTFFKDIEERMPNITHIDFRFQFPVHLIEPEITTLLKNLNKLQQVTFPRYCCTTKVIESMSRLEDLGSIEFQYYQYQGKGDPNDIVDFKPALFEGSFPSLWDLSLTVTFTSAAGWFDLPFAPSNLTILYIDSPVIEESSSIANIISVLARNCQLLKSLALLSFADASSPLVTPEKDSCITVETLRPLFKCSNLTSFELAHHYPVWLLYEDMEELAASWPSLESLMLNSEPVYLWQSKLTLRALLPFARNCSKLHTLGLFLDTTSDDYPSSTVTDAASYTTFKCLRRLSMGVSMIDDVGSVALYLSRFCPLHCAVESGTTWEDSSEFDPQIVEAIAGRVEKWTEVIRLLPLLTQLRIEERAKAKALKEEVDDLKIRTGLLMEKFGVALKTDGCITL